MKKPLNVLIVEDNPNDADLLLGELRRSGFDPKWKRIETEPDFLAEIKNPPDIILSDYSMPEFSGLRAAELLQASGLEIPFILISGTVGEEVAVNAMKHGATDYLLKDRIVRLGSAVERALREAQTNRERKQAELVLIALQNQLHRTLEHSPVVVYSHKVVDGRMIPQMVNENITRLLGFTVEECLSFEWWADHLHPKDRERQFASIPETFARDAFTCEYRIRHKAGHYIWLEDHRRTLRDRAGQPVEISGVWIDITVRKTAEEALEQIRQRLVLATASAGIGIWDWDVVANNLVWDTQMYALYGIRAEDFGGAYEAWQKGLHPDDRDRGNTAIAAAISGARDFNIQFRVVWPNGEMRHIEAHAAVQRAQSGAATRMIGVNWDITERKRAEQRIADELNYSHTMLEASPVGIMTYTTEGDAVSINLAAAQIVGATVQQLEAQNFRNIESWKHSGLLKAADHALQTGQPQDLETHLVTSFGREVWLSCRFIPFRHEVRGHLLCLMSDITERKRAEADLEQTHNQLLAVSRQAGMAEFATSVLHNVGNVLNSVNVAATCLLDSITRSKSASLAKVAALLRQHETDLGSFLTQDPKGKLVLGYLAKLADDLDSEQATELKELRELQKNIEHIKSIISAQQDSATRSQWTETLKLPELIEETLKMNANGLQRAGIQVILEFEEVPPIPMEKHKVLQILVNLVRNAMQACEGSSGLEKRLTVRVSQEAGRVRVAVADSGTGILPENLPRIFAHGFTTKKDGHGFGLHSSAASAREMGGSLNVQSEGLGKGATFTLELPLKPFTDLQYIPSADDPLHHAKF